MKLMERTDKELQELASKYDGVPKVKLPLSKDKRLELVEAIEKADVKMRLEAEAKVRADLGKAAAANLTRLGLKAKKKRKPSIETVMIEGGIHPVTGAKVQPSNKKYYTFHNLEEEGVKIALRKGEKYRFELFDGKIHCLPEWLVRNLRQTAVFPVYAQRKDPATGLEYSAHVANRPRFAFDDLEDAPDDIPFGVVIDHKLEAKYLPQSVLA